MTKDKSKDTLDTTKLPDTDAWMDNMTKIGTQSMQFWSQHWPNMMQQGLSGNPDPFGMQDIFSKMTTEAMADPNKMMDLSKNYMEQYMELCTRYMSGKFQEETGSSKSDRRFKNDSWDSHPGFRFLKDAYLMTADWLQDIPEHAGGLDEHEKQKLDFFVRQYADAMSPANFLMTNPDVMQETLETNGANLAKGMENFLKDMEAGNGRLKVSMVPENSFELGKNIALAEGDVVYRNDLIELICYNPTTETVSDTPLMIIPPWINKFYILDLQKKNSFIQWAVSQGQQVYVLSWANPTEKQADMDFGDYMKLGPLAAMDVIKERTGQKQVNAIGYCLGGTLLATTLAWLEAHKRKDIKSATFFTTLVDFSDPGELGVFIDDAQIKALEDKMKDQGYMDGADMAMSFNLLRANDLIWSFVINNYLMGKEPFPFDLLYWNSDSTRLPCKMHSWYLRKLYLENKLVEPGALEVNGTPIDLSTIKTPVFILSTHDDHIAPWKSCFKATGLYSGPIKFVLAGSGHIAGVINPPGERIKYGFWENNRRYKYADKWMDAAKYTEGSWWPTWREWLSKYDGDEIEAKSLPSSEKDSLAKAPGTYVRMK